MDADAVCAVIDRRDFPGRETPLHLAVRLPRIVVSVAWIRDFYMEITFHFESSVTPFIGRIAPSDRRWELGYDLHAEMSLPYPTV